MPIKQFITTTLFTAIETFFFNQAVMTGNYLLAFFWGLLVLRNLQTAFVFGKLIDVIDETLKKRKK
ncbi:hypothetical protein STRDD10_01348 [Streptococcus sp. DD10]|uniref:DUF3272 family protein n=1 Tax=Streptococcus sp. DD10 TaxID=1777878 RepID=UPI000793984C|nr:DUF3272 family protein [Streptococcus sp. DD10]KXT73782.1 hypothetical protein STRDD10_01348 [Streptococcus sp. DD10]